MFQDFQQALAQAGFLATPITEQQFNDLLALGYPVGEIESVASDVAAGFMLEELVNVQ